MPSATIELNAFQRLMWYWSQHIAYNAIHIVRIEQPLDMSGLKTKILNAIHHLGLGQPYLNTQGHIQWLPLETLTIARLNQALTDTINHELNHPFKSDDCPLRFFVIEDVNRYELGITYNHWVADAYAIRKLLQCITAEPSQGHSSLSLQAPNFKTLFKTYLGPFSSTLWLRKSLSALPLFYRAYRPALNNALHFHSQHLKRTLPSPTMQQIKQMVKKRNVTVNDFFCAIIAQIVGELSAPIRAQKKNRRQHIAIGNIVDLRHAATGSLAAIFGQFLSSYALLLNAPETKPFDSLLTEIATYTAAIKKPRTLVQHHFHFETALRCFGNHPRRKLLFFYKYAPLSAGISNVNVEDAWDTASDYWRVSPTGPLAPLVFSLTTFKDNLTVCLAYRTSAINEKIATTLCDQFCEKLQSFIT